MTILAGYFQETPHAAFMPRFGRGKIRAFFHSEVASGRSEPAYYGTLGPLPPRHEALIAAARAAFGGTINW